MTEQGRTLMLVGTRKGLWIGRSDDHETWSWDKPLFLMEEVYSCMIDTRGTRPRLLVGSGSPHWGPHVYRSDDLGETWDETPNIMTLPEDAGVGVQQVWQLWPGADSEADVVYAGTQPSALFRSEDRGETFELVRPLWDHPHRTEWGAGFGGQAIHTILPHPSDPDRMLVAMSTGGVYRTEDGRASWAPANKGIAAGFMPEGQQYPEFGQCVHKVTRHPEQPDRLFAQNHGGVYRSDDGGDSWVSIGDDLPSDFGFPVVVHPQQPETVFVFPNGAGESRFPPDARALVWRTEDAGETWQPLGVGLPESFYSTVVRDAMTADAAGGLYLGTRVGNVYTSTDRGGTWREVLKHIPDVMVVRAAVL
ncbi:MAG TPA: exo-alpha-sialidase [Nocardioidaceae bacterium]|nr:exo-alpha-sialidase [Nocardioidaceae bacterium]